LGRENRKGGAGAGNVFHRGRWGGNSSRQRGVRVEMWVFKGLKVFARGKNATQILKFSTKIRGGREGRAGAKLLRDRGRAPAQGLRTLVALRCRWLHETNTLARVGGGAGLNVM